MTLTDYKQQYLNFRVAVAQTRLISLSAGDALKDFPKRLPDDTRNTIDASFEDMRSKWSSLLGIEQKVSKS